MWFKPVTICNSATERYYFTRTEAELMRCMLYTPADKAALLNSRHEFIVGDRIMRINCRLNWILEGMSEAAGQYDHADNDFSSQDWLSMHPCLNLDDFGLPHWFMTIIAGRYDAQVEGIDMAHEMANFFGACYASRMSHLVGKGQIDFKQLERARAVTAFWRDFVQHNYSAEGEFLDKIVVHATRY